MGGVSELDPADRARFIERLNAVHNFPDEFRFKLIGDAEADMKTQAEAILAELCPDLRHHCQSKATASGKHVSLTFSLRVPDAETVVALYTRFHKLKGLRMII